ncbi:hypothetical protein SLEP1_g9307 [Rubroshorea leprosula]|uniref:NB-ARC domain-containing protein n=1 Tax=Rubroshorea leprosula TaxID=152421 RepID=A0AAV5I911_9ROSI|nr:hypothetical protein SLEP1_g9307 [Rubroshorea leprosula]
MDFMKDRFFGSVIDYVDCHRNFRNDVDDLKKTVVDLKRRRNDKVAELLTVDDSEKEVKEEVQGWLADARTVIEIEMPDIEEEVQNVPYLSRGSLGRRVRQKIQQVREIYDRGNFLEGLVIERPPPIGTSLLVENLEGEVDVKEKIWGYLRGHEVGMIGLCGIGGVGKTTIMMHINNELLKEPIGFDKVIWVTVSHPLSVAKLQHDIARELGKCHLESEDELKLAPKLMNVMQRMKFILILDDVWDKFTLQRVGIPKPTSRNGCKIVITSRSIDICNYLGCQIIKVPPLSKEESFNLFLDKVGRDVLQIPNLEEILKLVVGECAGLPLAIVVIARSMREVKDICEWRNALRELHQCVVGTVKEDSAINKERLIEDWIGGGLIEELGSRREMHDKGHAILNSLENNSLLEKANEEGYVKMHDVVRAMALRINSIGPLSCMVKASIGLTKMPNEDKWTEDLEKVSLMKNNISYIPSKMSPKCPMLSTLILKGNKRLRLLPECFFANMPVLKFLDLSSTGVKHLPDSISGLENLTALILRECRNLEWIPSLAKLKALNKLDLYDAGLLVVPKGIKMLVNLHYLDLSCPRLEELPKGIISNLSRLQYLRRESRDWSSTEDAIRGNEVTRLKKLETFEGRLNSLEDFNNYVKSRHFERLSHYVFEVVMEPRNYLILRKFNQNGCFKRVLLGHCNIGGEDSLVLPDDVQDLWFWDCNSGSDISVFLKNTTQLRRYTLMNCEEIECVVSSLSSSTAMNSLESLHLSRLPSLLDLVKVENIAASRAPTFPHIFSTLKTFSISGCSKMKNLFPCKLLQGLQNLEKIKVNACKEMEEIIGWEEEEGNQTTVAFILPKLRELYLGNLPELKKICPQSGVMLGDSLNSITICKCPRLKRIPLCLDGNGQPSPPPPALQEIRIYPRTWWESLEWDNPNAKNVLQPFVKDQRVPGTGLFIEC